MKEILNIDDQTITRYLLGESSSKEQTEIEERYFSDPDFLEQVLAIEDALIDAYVRDELTVPECERFQTHFLVSPDRREKVEIAEALRIRLEEARMSSHAPVAEVRSWRQRFSSLLRTEGRAMRLAFAAALLVAVVGGLWLFIENKRQRARLDEAQLEKTRRQQHERQLQQQLAARGNENKQLAQEQELEESAGETSKQKPAVGTPSISAPVIASFVLMPGLTRDIEETNKLVIPQAAQFVRLQLNLESKAEYKTYRVSLQRVGAGEIWGHTFAKSAAGATKEALIIKLPANLFSRGDYLLTLTGTAATGESKIAGDYPFTVVKQRN